MPAYNAEEFIADSIESVIKQSYTNWELIIVDDGSTDNTSSIVTLFLLLEPVRIKYIFQPNGKQGKARNTGIDNSEGSLISFLDADDLWHSEMLEQQVELLAQSNADMVFSNMYKFYDLKQPFEDAGPSTETTFSGKEGLRCFLKQNPVAINSVVAKKESIINAGVFKTDNVLQFAEDYDLWLRMLLNGCVFVKNHNYLAYYRMHASQSSRNVECKYWSILNMLHMLPERAAFKKEIEKAYCLWIRRCIRVNGDMDNEKLKKLSHFMPVRMQRICLALCAFLPATAFKPVLYKLTYAS